MKLFEVLDGYENATDEDKIEFLEKYVKSVQERIEVIFTKFTAWQAKFIFDYGQMEPYWVKDKVEDVTFFYDPKYKHLLDDIKKMFMRMRDLQRKKQSAVSALDFLRRGRAA